MPGYGGVGKHAFRERSSSCTDLSGAADRWLTAAGWLSHAMSEDCGIFAHLDSPDHECSYVEVVDAKKRVHLRPKPR